MQEGVLAAYGLAERGTGACSEEKEGGEGEGEGEEAEARRC